MKRLLFLGLFTVNSYANITDIHYFDANFTQVIVDDQNKTLHYKGHIQAAKPQYALWQYNEPINKKVYITPSKVVIVEPELEQAIVKKISRNFDFFSLIKNAKKIDNEHYLTKFDNKEYKIDMKNNILQTISYKDEFDNSVKIIFSDVNEKKKIAQKTFIPHIPQDYDLIKE